MNFASTTFLFIFLPVTLSIFWMIRGTHAAEARQLLLIAASLVFYMVSGLLNLGVLLASIAVNYAAGAWLAQSQAAKSARMTAMWIAVATNLVLLIGFKWAALENDAPDGFLSSDNILIPLALSFFTFQQIGFVVACYRGTIVRPSPFNYLFFVAFFPQLVMGPIVRFQDIDGQLKAGALRGWSGENFAVGLAIFLLGLAKKVLLADALFLPVERIFIAASAGAPVPFIDAWFAIIAFQLQLFLDFSSYADMAIGLARMVGVNLPINFDRPLHAVDRFDLWRRWHITFVVFMRTHVFLPLVRHAKLPVAGALAVTGILSGLWHGLGWTFVIWGLFQTAILLVVHYRSKLFRRTGARTGLRLVLAVATTFLTSALIGALFRSPTIPAAEGIYGALFSLDIFTGGPVSMYLSPRDCLMFATAAFAIWAWPEAREFFGHFWTALDPRPDADRAPRPRAWIRFGLDPCWGAAFALLSVAILLKLDSARRFIYAQF